MDNFRTLLAGPGAVLWGMGVAALVIAGALLAFGWRRYIRRHRVLRLLRRLGIACVRDLIIPDGVGGAIQLDYLLLRDGVRVLDVKNYRGALFGAENAPLWSQVVRAHSYKFANPLPENRLRVQAVRALLPEVPVTGRVVFTPEGWFPRGMPAGVSMLDTLAGDLGVLTGGAAQASPYQEAWQRLMAVRSDAVPQPQ